MVMVMKRMYYLNFKAERKLHYILYVICTECPIPLLCHSQFLNSLGPVVAPFTIILR